MVTMKERIERELDIEIRTFAMGTQEAIAKAKTAKAEVLKKVCELLGLNDITFCNRMPIL